MKVNVVNLSKSLELPTYATDGSDAMDLRACFDCDTPLINYDELNHKTIIDVDPNSVFVLRRYNRVLIPSGLKMQIPNGYEGQIKSRSGLSLKSGLVVTNGIGCIDSDYRGIIGIVISNITSLDQEIRHGDKLCQLAIKESIQVELVLVDSLDDTDRSENGFGSTGL